MSEPALSNEPAEVRDLRKRKELLAELDKEFDKWLPMFRELAQFYLPRQYDWLSGKKGQPATAANTVPSRIINAAATDALRTLAHGLMNGITSPARPWFALRLAGFPDTLEGYPQEWKIWLEECEHRLYMVLAESNFYNAMAVQYLDLSLFGTTAMIVYEDFEDVVRFYNAPVGEFRLLTSFRRAGDGLAREFTLTVRQLVQMFGLEKCSEQVKMWHRLGGSHLLQTVQICHLIEPNVDDSSAFVLPSQFLFREIYWQATESRPLRLAGFHENPLGATRWEVTGNDTYGTSPGQDALADVKQLQVAAKQRIVAKDKMNRPPIVADVALRGDPAALLPGGVSYVPGNSSFGAKPIYTVNPPLAEMTAEINDLIILIQRFFYNHLFRNVSNLETVRTATEINARKSEDMVLLGAILDRFENENLDPILRRVFNVMLRKELLPPLPAGLDPALLSIRYVSILADAQRAINTGSIERFMGAVGELGGIAPEVIAAVSFSELLREYAERLNVPAKALRSREETEEILSAERERVAMQEEALVGEQLTKAAKNLSETEVGSGASVLDQLI